MSAELVNPEIDRVDAVSGPATGIPFLLFKSADGPAEPAGDAEPASVEKAAEPAPDEAPAAAEAPAEEPVAKSEDPAPAAPEEPAEAPTEVAKSEEEAAPAEAPAEEVAKSEEPAAEVPAEPVAKAGTVALPSGLLELLGEVVAAYQQLVETQSTAPESPADVEAPDGGAPVEPAAGDGDEPLADAMTDEAAPAAPAEAPAAPEKAPAEHPAPPAHAAPEKPAAPAHAAPAAPPAPAPGHEAPEAPAPAAEGTAPDDEDKDTKKLAKSMESLILEAVAKATEPLREENEELKKRLERVESTPVNDGPFLAGQTPGASPGQASLRGQDVGGVAEGLQKSATPEPPSGMEALAKGLLNTWGAR